MTADTDASTKFGALQPSKAQVTVLPIKNLQVGSTNFLPQPGIGNNKPRLIGIDVTRGLALLGMIAVHALIPYDDNFEPNWVSYIATGHASAVFAVLAGVGLSLTTGRARVPWSKALPTAAGVGGRALAIAAVGFVLGYTDAVVTGVILPYYAVLFLLSIPLLFLRTRSLVVVGIVAAVAVPVLSQFVRPALPIPTLENPTFDYLLTDPLGLLSELLVTGAYPALPWMAYLCAGLIVGRLTLSSLKVARRMLIVGVLLAVSAGVAAWVLLGPLGGQAALQLAGPGLGDGDADSVNDLLTFGFDGTTPTTSWWWLATGAPHAGTPLDLLGTVGSAVALLGAMLLLGHVVQPLLRKVIELVSAPLAAAGAMTLTLYTAHVVFMNSPLDVFEPMDGYIFQVAAVLLFGLGWRLAVGRGPLETAVTAFATSARTRVTSAIEHRRADQQAAADYERVRHIIEIPTAPKISAPLRPAGQTVDPNAARPGSVRLRHQVVAKKTTNSPPAMGAPNRASTPNPASGSKDAGVAAASSTSAPGVSGSMRTTGAPNVPNHSAARDDTGQKAAPSKVADFRPRSVRLTGIDITRGLALLGMMAVHTLVPYDENFDPNWVTYVATGHSAATFAVLAGIGLSLTTGRARVPRGKAGVTAAAIAGRAAAIGVIGLILGYTDAAIAGVILPYYAVLFVLAIPLLFMRTRAVVVVGLIAAIVVPVFSQFLRPALPGALGENLTFGYVLSDPLSAVSELLFTGSYPVLPWMAYICAGIVVGRMDLTSVRNARRLLIGGAALGLAAFGAAWALLGPLGGAAALRTAGAGEFGVVDDLLAFGFDGTTPTTSWWWLAVGSSHAGTPLDLVGTIGGALALLGAMLLLGHVAQPILRRVIDAVTAPVAAAGAMTLTLYTAHIVFMNSQLEIFEPTPAYIIQVVAVLLFGLVWRRTVGRGPLEAAVAKVGAWARALVGGRQSDDRGIDQASVGDTAKLTGSVPVPVAVIPVVQQSIGELGTPSSTIDRSVIDPVGRKLSMHGPVLSRPVPTSGSRRLPGPFVARPPRKGEGMHRRPGPGRPER